MDKSVFDRFQLDHIGIAVNSLDEGMGFYRCLGYSDVETEEVTSEGVRVAFLPTKNGANLELLEPMNKESPIAKFLQKKGPGIHHICLRVDDLRKVLSELKEQGVRLINEEPKAGAHGCLVAFVHPKSTGGVLLELSQKMGT